MTKLTALLSAALVTASLIASANPKESTIKEIQQNDKVRVYEATYQPGDISPSTKRPMRVVYALKGGTLERTYADGSKEKSEWRTGETRIISEERAYEVKNIGKGVVRLLIVAVK